MKKWMELLVVLVVALCFCSKVFAQVQKEEEPITFGIGMALYPTALAGDLESKFQAGGLANFYFPVQIGHYIRFEPEIGLYFYTADATLPDSTTSVKEHQARQIVRTGAGLFYTIRPDSTFQYYIGSRLGVLSSEGQVTHTPLSSRYSEVDRNYAVFYAGASFGAEYYFSKHFSFGGELQFNHYGYGLPVINSSPFPSVDSSQSAWTTTVALSARFYF